MQNHVRNKMAANNTYFVGQKTAKLQAIFQLNTVKNMEKKQTKDFNPAEEGSFPNKLQ